MPAAVEASLAVVPPASSTWAAAEYRARSRMAVTLRFRRQQWYVYLDTAVILLLLEWRHPQEGYTTCLSLEPGRVIDNQESGMDMRILPR